MGNTSAVPTESDEQSENGESNSDEEIPSSNFDPVAFQIYLKLLILDAWSPEDLKALNLTPNTLLSLLAICREFGISKAIINLEEAAERIIRSFECYKENSEFLEMSQSNLATAISYDILPLDEVDICECVCRWAEFQCKQKEMEVTGKNMRAILGPVLFEIRFPLISKSEFSEICRRYSSLLVDHERVAIYDFIDGIDDVEKDQKYDGRQLPFKTHKRKPLSKTKFDGPTLYLTRNVKIVEESPFVCDGAEKGNWFQISRGEITLHGIGFFGPIDQDSYFDVIVEIKRRIHPSFAYESGKKEKRIFARKQEIFHFMFDEPITIEPVPDTSTWAWPDHYCLCFSLKGPNTLAADRIAGAEGPTEENGVKFRFYWDSGRHQVAKFLYKKL